MGGWLEVSKDQMGDSSWNGMSRIGTNAREKIFIHTMLHPTKNLR